MTDRSDIVSAHAVSKIVHLIAANRGLFTACGRITGAPYTNVLAEVTCRQCKSSTQARRERAA